MDLWTMITRPDVQILSGLRSLHQGRGLGDRQVVGHQLYVDLAGVQLPTLTILLQISEGTLEICLVQLKVS